MDWVHVVIPLIAMAVYLISHVVSTRQDELRRQQTKARRPPALPERSDLQEGNRQRERSTLDARIEEARRRRETQETAPVVKPPPLPQVVILPRPLPTLAPPAAQPPRPTEPPRARPPVPDARPAVTASTPGEAAQVMLRLLRDRRSLAAALLLHEVLGPPVARRSRRRP
jgi:hypothetical protein